MTRYGCTGFRVIEFEWKRLENGLYNLIPTGWDITYVNSPPPLEHSGLEDTLTITNALVPGAEVEKELKEGKGYVHGTMVDTFYIVDTRKDGEIMVYNGTRLKKPGPSKKWWRRSASSS